MIRSSMRALLFTGVFACCVATTVARGAYTNNILLTGYWPPTNEMVRRFSTSTVQNPDGWIGGNWEGRGYNVYSFFPEFPGGVGANRELRARLRQVAATRGCEVYFPDLSLSIIKLLGPGEYMVQQPGTSGEQSIHFGLAVHDYTHSTAPNRRFADLVTQRLVKAVLTNLPAPYTDDELSAIAIAMASDILRCSRRISIEMGRMRSSGDLKYPPGPYDFCPPVNIRPLDVPSIHEAMISMPVEPI
jgi:hypothetical protein